MPQRRRWATTKEGRYVYRKMEKGLGARSSNEVPGSKTAREGFRSRRLLGLCPSTPAKSIGQVSWVEKVSRVIPSCISTSIQTGHNFFINEDKARETPEINTNILLGHCNSRFDCPEIQKQKWYWERRNRARVNEIIREIEKRTRLH